MRGLTLYRMYLCWVILSIHTQWVCTKWNLSYLSYLYARNGTILMLSMRGIKLGLLWVCAEWHYNYADNERDDTFLTLSMRGITLAFLWVCTELHYTYAEYARNDTCLTLSMHGTTLYLCWVCAEWHLPSLSMRGKKLSLPWVSAEWDYTYAEYARNDTCFTLRMRGWTFALRWVCP